MTEPLVDLRALLIEREDFEGGMVGKLREGLAQGGPQVRNLKEISDVLQKRLSVAAGPQQKKIHLKLGVVEYYLGHIRTAVEHLAKAEGPLAAFFLGQAHVYLGQARAYAEEDGDGTDHLEAAFKAFDKAEKSGYAAQQVQLQKAGVLRLQGHLSEAKTILAKLKDAAATMPSITTRRAALPKPRATRSGLPSSTCGRSSSIRAIRPRCSASAFSTTCKGTIRKRSASTSAA